MNATRSLFFTTWTNPAELLPMMRTGADRPEALHLKTILIHEGFQNIDLETIGQDAWAEMLETAQRFAELDAGE